MPDTVGAATSRRDEHKRRTRAALRDAALDLFSAQGFDSTTTEEIADRAGVAVRTFFRYFPTKESVLYIGESDWIHSVVTELAEQPASVGDLEAVRAAILRSTTPLANGRERLLQYSRAVASSPTLRGREQDHHRENARILADAVAERRGVEPPDRRSTMISRISLLTYRRALDMWLGGEASVDLDVVVAREFDLLMDVLATG